MVASPCYVAILNLNNVGTDDKPWWAQDMLYSGETVNALPWSAEALKDSRDIL